MTRRDDGRGGLGRGRDASLDDDENALIALRPAMMPVAS